MSLFGFQQFCRRMATLFIGLYLVASAIHEVIR